MINEIDEMTNSGVKHWRRSGLVNLTFADDDDDDNDNNDVDYLRKKAVETSYSYMARVRW